MADFLPARNAQYLENAYWNTRFEGEQQYDWLKSYSQFKHLCTPHLHLDDSILILGCGNSTLTQDLYDDGYKNLTSIDLSNIVIERMRAKSAAARQNEIKWQVGSHRLLHLYFCSDACSNLQKAGDLSCKSAGHAMSIIFDASISGFRLVSMHALQVAGMRCRSLTCWTCPMLTTILMLSSKRAQWTYCLWTMIRLLTPKQRSDSVCFRCWMRHTGASHGMRELRLPVKGLVMCLSVVS